MLEENQNNIGSQDDRDLEFASTIRKKLIKFLTDSGMPETRGGQESLLEALNQVDRTALAKKKMDVDKGANENQLMALETLANVFTSNAIDNHHKSLEGQMVAEPPRFNPIGLEPPPEVPGEMSDVSPVRTVESLK